MGNVYIGTSGFDYKDWTKKFYPNDIDHSRWLEYYSKFFNSVELNVTFYRLPREATFRKWHDKTPRDFAFSVKGSRYITHTKRLLVDEDILEKFFKRSKLLQEKLKVVLWQLPPNMSADPDRLENFLKLLEKFNVKNAFEFREKSWFNVRVYDLLSKYGVALVVCDSPSFPRSEVMIADFTYIRFHGGKHLYLSEYSEGEIRQWKEKVMEWSNSGDVYAYFNNDANAFAIKNALMLKEI